MTDIARPLAHFVAFTAILRRAMSVISSPSSKPCSTRIFSAR